MRGYFGIGIYQPKTVENIGTLWRSARLYGAAFIYTIGRRYKRQASDTMKTPSHIPLFNFTSIEDLCEHLPHGAPLIGVELDPRARPLAGYGHAERACYLLGAEDNGLPPSVVDRCHSLIQIECPAPQSMNVAVAGSLVMYSRHLYREGMDPRWREKVANPRPAYRESATRVRRGVA